MFELDRRAGLERRPGFRPDSRGRVTSGRRTARRTILRTSTDPDGAGVRAPRSSASRTSVLRGGHRLRCGHDRLHRKSDSPPRGRTTNRVPQGRTLCALRRRRTSARSLRQGVSKRALVEAEGHKSDWAEGRESCLVRKRDKVMAHRRTSGSVRRRPSGRWRGACARDPLHCVDDFAGYVRQRRPTRRPPVGGSARRPD